MAGKPKDYAGMIAVYHNISKQRELTPEETERLIYLTKREKRVISERRWKQANREKLLKKKKEYDKTPAGKAGIKRRNERAYAKNRTKRILLAREWRKNNPEKYQAQKEIKNERRRKQREQERENKSVPQ